ncbi:MAG: EAL domain-containing protein, partial [Pseudomonadota bacterium]
DGGRVGLRIDITSQVRSRQRAEKAEQRLRDAIEALPAGFWLFDADDRLIMFNERYKNMFTRSAGALSRGTTYEDVLRYGLQQGQYPEAEGREEAWLAEVLETRGRNGYELEYQLDNGRWIRSFNSPTSEGGYVGFRIDITELKNKQTELEHAAESDALTGLLNRRGVTRYLEDLERSIPLDERVVALHVDLDKFKAVNDATGHEAGDFVLAKVAERMQRDCDKREVVARIGGDEFLLLGPTDLGNKALVERAEKMRSALIRPIVFHGRICQVGATVGVGTWEPGRGPADRVVADADTALNVGKRAGRNCTRFFTSEMRRASVEQAVIAQDLREALEEGQIDAWFQPQFSTDGAEVTGFESLARWMHPTRGVISAGVFLPAAIEAGIAADIDRVVRRSSLEFLSELTAVIGGRPKVSINISSAQLSDASIVGQVDWQVDGKGLSPDQVRIEILESTLLDDRSSQIAENIRAFAERGYPIELDDFGTGHAAIASLRQYPVSRIKVDRSLVQGIDRDESSFVITETIVILARRLGVEVLAEGVETPEELAILSRLGCSAVQGYHLGRPMPAPDAIGWLSEREGTIWGPAEGRVYR